MHIADLKKGNLGANAIVGGGIPIAVGGALAAKLRGSDQVAVSFFGDGASNQGTFHEGLNLASVWKLPAIFICENNGFGISVPVKQSTSVGDIGVRGKGYDMPGVTVDGNDGLAVYEAVGEAVRRARAGEGPSLIENVTYRWRGHSKSDVNRYRTQEEIEAWKEKDPIKRFRDLLVAEGTLTERQADNTKDKAYGAIDAAVAFADGSPEPTLDTIEEGVYA